MTLTRDGINGPFDNGGRATTYDFDPAGRLSAVKVDTVERANYRYFVNGLLRETSYADGSKATYTYDAANRIKTLTNRVRGQEAQAFTYGYDANGNRLTETITRNGQSFRAGTYTYDLLDRVLTADYTGGVTCFP